MRLPSAAAAAASIFPDLLLQMTIHACNGFLSIEFRGNINLAVGHKYIQVNQTVSLGY